MMWHCIHFKMLSNFFSLEKYFGQCPRKKIILLSHHISTVGPLWILCLIVCFCSNSKGSWKSNILRNWRGKRNQTWGSYLNKLTFFQDWKSIYHPNTASVPSKSGLNFTSLEISSEYISYTFRMKSSPRPIFFSYIIRQNYICLSLIVL